ncbi:MAG TPA: 50S ribosomal protein L13 [Bacteroidales bacterium]|nr:50S ribosomal protein L13 [Bacteroidales bacterium]
MDTLSYKTRSISVEAAREQKEWILVDAENQVLGRMASKVATILRGKHKTSYTPHIDCGDNVIIINADKVVLTGNKMADKEYVRYTGYPGGQRVTTAEEMLRKHPERLVEKAVKGMLPRNRLGRQMYRNLRVFVGPEHSHEAQQPRKIDLSTIK